MAPQVPAAPLANTARGGLSLGNIWKMLSDKWCDSRDCSGQGQELGFDDHCSFPPTQDTLWFYDPGPAASKEQKLAQREKKNYKKRKWENILVFFLRNIFLVTPIPLQTTDSIAPSTTSANFSEREMQELIG